MVLPGLLIKFFFSEFFLIDSDSSFSSTKMDANRRQSGIQQLLAAEQEAQQIVNAARTGNSLSLSVNVMNKHNIRERVVCRCTR